MTQQEINFLLSRPTNSTYDEFTVIGSSCQHIHVPRLTEEQFQQILHFITFTSVWFNAFAIFCVLTRTSVSMGRFRWCLLNLQIWTLLTDLMLACLVTPRFQMPIIAGKCLGAFVSLGISLREQVYIGFASFGGMIASTAALFVYRHQVIVGPSHLLRMKKRNLLMLLAMNYILYMNTTVPALYTAPENQVKTKIEILKRERCPPKDLLHPNLYVLQDDLDLIPYFIFLIVFVGAECGLLALHSAWQLFFSTLSANFSRRTRILQIKFLGALVLQIAVPTTLCYAPITYYFITTVIDHYWQFANDICVFVMATHGTVSSICVVLLYDCYREYFCHCLRKMTFCCKSRGRSHTSENSSVRRSGNSRNAINPAYIT